MLQVVRGGKILGFRAVVVVGNGAGRVGVGCSSGREVATATKRALVDARKAVVSEGNWTAGIRGKTPVLHCTSLS